MSGSSTRHRAPKRTMIPTGPKECPLRSKAVDAILAKPAITIPASLVDTGIAYVRKGKKR